MTIPWKTNAVFSCYSDEGERISVIEQCRNDAPLHGGEQDDRYRYVLGNGNPILRIHGSSYVDPETCQEYIRVFSYSRSAGA